MIETRELRLRIILDDPPSGVLYCLQRTSRADCVEHQRSSEGDLVFDVVVQVKESGDTPDFRGPFVQGRKGERHINLLIGTLAGDAASEWTRGAKIHLSDIPLSLIKKLPSRQNALFAAQFPGRARSGAPSCATLRPLDEGWYIAEASAPV